MTNLKFKFKKDSKVCKCLATTLGPFVGVYVNSTYLFSRYVCFKKYGECFYLSLDRLCGSLTQRAAYVERGDM